MPNILADIVQQGKEAVGRGKKTTYPEAFEQLVQQAEATHLHTLTIVDQLEKMSKMFKGKKGTTKSEELGEAALDLSKRLREGSFHKTRMEVIAREHEAFAVAEKEFAASIHDNVMVPLRDTTAEFWKEYSTEKAQLEKKRRTMDGALATHRKKNDALTQKKLDEADEAHYQQFEKVKVVLQKLPTLWRKHGACFDKYQLLYTNYLRACTNITNKAAKAANAVPKSKSPVPKSKSPVTKSRTKSLTVASTPKKDNSDSDSG